MAASDQQLINELNKTVTDLKRNISRRNGLIRSLRRRGVPLRQIAKAADMSHTRVDQLTVNVVTPRLKVDEC